MKMEGVFYELGGSFDVTAPNFASMLLKWPQLEKISCFWIFKNESEWRKCAYLLARLYYDGVCFLWCPYYRKIWISVWETHTSQLLENSRWFRAEINKWHGWNWRIKVPIVYLRKCNCYSWSSRTIWTLEFYGKSAFRGHHCNYHRLVFIWI